jgi:hypothetical protein
MAGESRSTPFGFETPQEVRSRIGKADADVQQGISGDFNTLLAQTAFGAGRGITRGISGAFGLQQQSPEVAKAQARQSIMQSTDITSPEGLRTAAESFRGLGDFDTAFNLLDRANKLSEKEEISSERKRPKITPTTTEALIATGGNPRRPTKEQVRTANAYTAGQRRINKTLSTAGLIPNRGELDFAATLVDEFDLDIEDAAKQQAALSVGSLARKIHKDSGGEIDLGAAMGQASERVKQDLISGGAQEDTNIFEDVWTWTKGLFADEEAPKTRVITMDQLR